MSYFICSSKGFKVMKNVVTVKFTSKRLLIKEDIFSSKFTGLIFEKLGKVTMLKSTSHHLPSPQNK